MEGRVLISVRQRSSGSRRVREKGNMKKGKDSKAKRGGEKVKPPSHVGMRCARGVVISGGVGVVKGRKGRGEKLLCTRGQKCRLTRHVGGGRSHS